MFKTLAAQWHDYRSTVLRGMAEGSPLLQLQQRAYYFAVLSALAELDKMAALENKLAATALTRDYLECLVAEAAAFTESVREGRS